VDRQIHTYSSYLHIFSAGNSNNNDCGYGAGSRWGNITGGHKQAKNAIATANVNFEGEIVNSSSRGPATDGRIKPDIAANGASNYSLRPNNNYAPFGGTSGAAPCVAGVLAQLNHAFRDQYGADAPSALLKASLLNGARDVGEPGPDFIYGFGLLDAFNSY
jgi:subtilisin family serine protease